MYADKCSGILPRTVRPSSPLCVLHKTPTGTSSSNRCVFAPHKLVFGTRSTSDARTRTPPGVRRPTWVGNDAPGTPPTGYRALASIVPHTPHPVDEIDRKKRGIFWIANFLHLSSALRSSFSPCLSLCLYTMTSPTSTASPCRLLSRAARSRRSSPPSRLRSSANAARVRPHHPPPRRMKQRVLW